MLEKLIEIITKAFTNGTTNLLARKITENPMDQKELYHQMQEQEYDSSNSGILTYRIQVKILLIVCILGFIGFAVFNAIAELLIGVVFFAALALISFIYLLETCIYRLTYHGITISIKKLFSTKEYLASEIIELTKDQLDDIYITFINGKKIKVEHYCNNREAFYSYIWNILDSKRDSIMQQRATQGKFICREKKSDNLMMFAGFVFLFAVSAYFIVKDYNKGILMDEIKSVIILPFITLFPVVAILINFNYRIYVDLKSQCISYRSFLIKRRVPFSALTEYKLNRRRDQYIFYYKMQNGKTKSFRIILNYSNMDLFEQVFFSPQENCNDD